MNWLDGAFVASCVAGLVGALWLFDIALDTNKNERLMWSARELAIASALGDDVISVSIRKGSALPYRVEYLENVYGFSEASSMLRFIVLIGHGLHDEEVAQAVRACEGVSVLHPVFR